LYIDDLVHTGVTSDVTSISEVSGPDRSLSYSAIPGSGPLMEELPLASQPIGVSVTMRPYQLQALHWMLQRERDDSHQLSSHNNLSPSSCNNINDSIKREDYCPLEGPVWAPSLLPPLSTEVNPLWQPLVAVRLTQRSPSFIKTSSLSISAEVSKSINTAFSSEIYDLKPDPMSRSIGIWWDRYSHRFSFSPPRPPKACCGGILADEMGKFLVQARAAFV
jgi:hypothetical protein